MTTKTWKIVGVIGSVVLAIVGAGTIVYHVYHGVIDDVIGRFDRKLLDAKRSIEQTFINTISVIKPNKK